MMHNVTMDLGKINRFRSQHPYIFYLAFIASLIAIILLISFIQPSSTTGSSHNTTRNIFPSQRSYAQQYYVSPAGKDTNNGTSEQAAFYSIDKAVSIAEAGNTINLADGRYDQTISSVKSGTSDKTITIQGSKDAVVGGNPEEGRVVEIMHDYITLKGFTVDGLSGDGSSKDNYRDKLIYVIGATKHDGVTGLKIIGMTVQNAGGECIRLRYFATNNAISNTIIRNCGIFDFGFKGDGKNGEGIYIGTAPEQRADNKNPTSDIDESNNNRIYRNIIDTFGNECVDLKEGSTGNIVEHNICQNQMDEDSAGLDARGGGNTFRYNTSKNNKGAGIRLGGDKDNDGTKNNVYGNILENNEAGAIKILRTPQGRICENVIKYDSDELNKKYNKHEFTKKC
ncbi:MAG: Secreted protein [Candidatus Saccharibacteria bacterium]|nr:Secreted protein [Candidatus Saccharibacteria bacterium]